MNTSNNEGWIKGRMPDKSGYYWVCLEREPGMVHLFFYYHPNEKGRGWDTDIEISSGAPSPTWVDRQTPRMKIFGDVWAYKKANVPKEPSFP
jgi:hypothetical protein